jgi:hypothetical protein
MSYHICPSHEGSKQTLTAYLDRVSGEIGISLAGRDFVRD